MRAGMAHSWPGWISVISGLFRGSEVTRCLLWRAVTYGLERLNAEVAAWMRGKLMPDGTKSLPPYNVRPVTCCVLNPA
jgi:hypothetical protein